ncbi:hypothetical protein OHA72_32685 [Dactylosporangium sp. NBC_01737]|uniref:hypothetical protein n=1 Tax=Dactylosporangium sp. NBC_01737 TaxID=2975959 RepID=UPI002E137790|nr:hypothetical protein OHA72_32685 [Dactylosporangium sp. NBC_01737]
MHPVFDAVLRLHPGDEVGRMLRSPGLKTGGRCYAFTSGDDMIVKLPAARVAELVAAGVGLPCSPRPGRPMREWVRLPAQDCLAHVLDARAFVAVTPPR